MTIANEVSGVVNASITSNESLDNGSTSPPVDLDSSPMSINDHPIPAEIRQVILDDSTFLKSQCEDGETVNLIVCSMTDDMRDVYFAFLSLKKTDLATAKRIWDEDTAEILKRNPRSSRLLSPPCFLDKIYDCIDYKFRTIEFYVYLQELPLKTLYEFTEFLDSMMSESLRFAIFAVARALADSVEALYAIEQFTEEQETESVLSKHELAFHQLHRKRMVTKEPYPYRFIDSIWVSIKIQLFAYAVVSNRGCSFFLTGDMGVLIRSESESDLERRITALRQKCVTRLEMLQNGDVTSLGEFAEFNLKDCRMIYADPVATRKRKHSYEEEPRRAVSYKGGVFFHHLLGAIRHGRGTTFYNPSGLDHESHQRVYRFDENDTYLHSYPSVEEAAEASGEDVKVVRDTCNSENSHAWEWGCNIEMGVYILDEMHRLDLISSLVVIPPCECSICTCEDSSEEGDYGVCYFSSEKQKWGGLGFDDKNSTATVDYCATCAAEMVVHETRLLEQLRDEGIEEANDPKTETTVTCITESREMNMLL